MSILLVDILENFLGEHQKLNEDSGQVSFHCPECDNGRGKGNLEINYDKGVFKCWSCAETNQMSGPMIKLLKKYGTPKILRDYLLVKPDTDIILSKEHLPQDVELPEGYKRLSDCNNSDWKSAQAKSYLSKRGILNEIIDKFDIGYTIKGRFFNRIIIPSYDSNGKLNYFIARWFSNEPNKLKYINPEAEKKEIIFNEGKINWDATIYLVEGVFDHIVTPNSIPLLGKFISEQLLEMLHDNAQANIVILLDDDAKLDAINLYKQLNFGNLMGRIKICIPPTGYDPSLIYEKLGSNGIVTLLKSSRKPTSEELY